MAWEDKRQSELGLGQHKVPEPRPGDTRGVILAMVAGLAAIAGRTGIAAQPFETTARP